jgi:hypothetical protein
MEMVYRMIYKDASWQEKTPIDCSYCNNQGEVENNGARDK